MDNSRIQAINALTGISPAYNPMHAIWLVATPQVSTIATACRRTGATARSKLLPLYLSAACPLAMPMSNLGHQRDIGVRIRLVRFNLKSGLGRSREFANQIANQLCGMAQH